MITIKIKLLLLYLILNLQDHCTEHLSRIPSSQDPESPNRGRRGTVEPCALWGLRGLQALGFESCPRSECRMGFLIRGNAFLAGGL
ncbi:hypothetical protein E2C01_083383 [Portunus trituberculatus]|uniref:Secreted protein n=1 Tax=Portunus trituberculatus TaxID=210409 RepID=A0A5B7J6F8_PORTR|nr:hypothetical protein [Portunus trituberculatus]